MAVLDQSNFYYLFAFILYFFVLVALWHMESSWTRNQTHVSCIDRQSLNHWTTKEVLINFSDKMVVILITVIFKYCIKYIICMMGIIWWTNIFQMTHIILSQNYAQVKSMIQSESTSMGFKVIKYKTFIDMVSDSSLQLTFKKSPATCWVFV